MAKRGTKTLPARKPVSEDDSLLIRSAESLGRVIGSLQRQMQGTSARLSRAADDALQALPDVPRVEDVLKRARKATGQSAEPRKARSRKTSGGRARKTAAAPKASAGKGRKRS
jgi:hypothetical protein